MLQMGHRLAQETGWMVMYRLPWVTSSGCYEETETCHNASPSRGAVSGTPPPLKGRFFSLFTIFTGFLHACFLRSVMPAQAGIQALCPL